MNAGETCVPSADDSRQDTAQESWYNSHSWVTWKEWEDKSTWKDDWQEPPNHTWEVFADLGLEHLLYDAKELRRVLSCGESKDLLEAAGFGDVFDHPSKKQELKLQLDLLKRVQELFRKHDVRAMIQEPDMLIGLAERCQDLQKSFEECGYPQGFLRHYSQLREAFRQLGLEDLLDNVQAMKHFFANHTKQEELVYLRAAASRVDEVEDQLKQRDEEVARVRQENQALRERLAAFEDVSQSIPPTPQQRWIQLPILELDGKDRGKVLESLRCWGAVHLAPGWDKANVRPNWLNWHTLMMEATRQRKKFLARECVQNKQLRFSLSEDLSRTMIGEAKSHQPDRRVSFGISDSAVQSPLVNWEDLQWAVDGFRNLKASLCEVVERELRDLCAQDGDRETLAVKIVQGWENWGKSNLRHCVYPENGTCSAHTDYGLVTLQYSTGPGLQILRDDTWLSLDSPRGCALLMAGDSLERLTNGMVKAVQHRVCMADEERSSTSFPEMKFDCRSLEGARQSHILFLAPSADTLVAPLQCQLRHDGTDLAAVRYGDWHRAKVNLAFGPCIAHAQRYSASGP